MNECKADTIGRCSFDCMVCRYDDYENFKRKYDSITINKGNPAKKSFAGPLLDSTKNFNSLDANLGSPL